MGARDDGRSGRGHRFAGLHHGVEGCTKVRGSCRAKENDRLLINLPPLFSAQAPSQPHNATGSSSVALHAVVRANSVALSYPPHMYAPISYHPDDIGIAYFLSEFEQNRKDASRWSVWMIRVYCRVCHEVGDFDARVKFADTPPPFPLRYFPRTRRRIIGPMFAQIWSRMA